MKMKGRMGDPGKQPPSRLPEASPLRLNFDAQAVESALQLGITDMKEPIGPGEMAYRSHYSVKLNGGVTKDQLISFISEARPSKDIDAFFKADKAGLVTIEYEGQRMIYQKFPC